MLTLEGSINMQLGKDPWGHCKDYLWYLWQCWSWGFDWHTTWKGSTRTLQGLPLTMLILGGWLTHNLERNHEDIARITSDNVDPGGLIDTQLGKDPWGQCKDYLWQCWSRGLIDTQLGKDPKGHCKNYLWQCWFLGGWLTHNLERICEDFTRITSDNVDPGGSINTQLGKDPWGHCKDYLLQCWSWGLIDTQLGKDPWGHHKDYLWQCWSWGVNWHKTWKGSMRTLQGLPLTMLILVAWLTHNLERIHEDITRITSDNVDPGGLIKTQLGKDPWGHCKDYLWQCWSWGVDWHTTWKGTMRTLQGLPLIMLIQGVDWHTTVKGSMRTLQGLPLTMLILGGQLTHNLERIHEDIARITSDNVDWGVDWHTTWKGSVRTLHGLPLTMLILGGQSTHNLERIHEDIARITCYNVDPGVWFKHNLERIHEDITRISSDNVDPGGWLTHNLERIHKDIARITSDNVDPGGWLTHNLERIHEDIARITSDNVDPGGQLTHNLERIHKDIARITSDNVDPGWVNRHTTWKGSVRTSQVLPLTMLIWGSINTQHGKVPWGHCKDYLWQCWSGVCVNQHTTWKGSMRTLQGLPLIMLILGVNWHTTWKGSARTLQGLPLTMLTLEGSINMQLGKDPWGHCKDYLWECWSWGSIDTQLGKDPQGHCKDYLWQCLSWVGSIDTQLGKDPWGHCKDYLWQCWSWGLIDTQLGKDPWGHHKDYLWQCWSWGS